MEDILKDKCQKNLRKKMGVAHITYLTLMKSEQWYKALTLHYENQDLRVVLCCFKQPDIYELQDEAARESIAKPRSI